MGTVRDFITVWEPVSIWHTTQTMICIQWRFWLIRRWYKEDGMAGMDEHSRRENWHTQVLTDLTYRSVRILIWHRCWICWEEKVTIVIEMYRMVNSEFLIKQFLRLGHAQYNNNQSTYITTLIKNTRKKPVTRT